MKRIREDGKIVRGKGTRPKRRLFNHACPVCKSPCGAAAACPEHLAEVRMKIPQVNPLSLQEQRMQLRELDRAADDARAQLDEIIDRLLMPGRG